MSLTKWLFGESGGAQSTFQAFPEGASDGLICEGSLLLYSGLRWKSGYWRLAWRDPAQKNEVVLVRYPERTSPTPVPAKSNPVLLSRVKTLVPIEKHEVEPRYSVTQTKAVGRPRRCSGRTRRVAVA